MPHLVSLCVAAFNASASAVSPSSLVVSFCHLVCTFLAVQKHLKKREKIDLWLQVQVAIRQQQNPACFLVSSQCAVRALPVAFAAM